MNNSLLFKFILILSSLGITKECLSQPVELDWEKEGAYSGFLLRYIIINNPEDELSNENLMSLEVIISNGRQSNDPYFDSLFYSSGQTFGYTYIAEEEQRARFLSFLDSSVYVYFGGCHNIGSSTKDTVLERIGKVPDHGCVIADRMMEAFKHFDTPPQQGIYYYIDKVRFIGKISSIESFPEYMQKISRTSKYPNALGFYHYESYRAQIRNRRSKRFEHIDGYPVMTFLELCYSSQRYAKIFPYNNIKRRRCRKTLKRVWKALQE